jgi:hypothetical protein
MSNLVNASAGEATAIAGTGPGTIGSYRLETIFEEAFRDLELSATTMSGSTICSWGNHGQGCCSRIK